MWEAKVITAADMDADVETNWKHKVTPVWGELMMSVQFNHKMQSDKTTANIITNQLWSSIEPSAIKLFDNEDPGLVAIPSMYHSLTSNMDIPASSYL